MCTMVDPYNNLLSLDLESYGFVVPGFHQSMTQHTLCARGGAYVIFWRAGVIVCASLITIMEKVLNERKKN